MTMHGLDNVVVFIWRN